MREELRALYLRHRELGFSRRESLRRALYCLDASPAPKWTHMENAK